MYGEMCEGGKGRCVRVGRGGGVRLGRGTIVMDMYWRFDCQVVILRDL